MKKFVRQPEARIPFTKDGYQNILAERAKLLSERPEAVEHLRKSREMGDLSENGYYKASRAKLSFLDAQIRRVERLVKLGVIVESHGTGRVEIGSQVIISDGKKEYSYMVVGGYESNPSKKTISHISPIGKALMGKQEKDQITFETPKGSATYTLVKVV